MTDVRQRYKPYGAVIAAAVIADAIDVDGGACYGSPMRASDVFEIVIAVTSASIVIGAVGMILYRVTRGNPETARLAALKKQFTDDAQKPPSP